jgi:hypothetical protein
MAFRAILRDSLCEVLTCRQRTKCAADRAIALRHSSRTARRFRYGVSRGRGKIVLVPQALLIWLFGSARTRCCRAVASPGSLRARREHFPRPCASHVSATTVIPRAAKK